MNFLIELTPGGLTPAGQSLLARQLLARILKESFGVDPLPEISVLPGGKPVFSKPVFSKEAGLHFSLSHCRSAVMAVVDTSAVGCDIEDIPEKIDPPGLIDVAFSDDERRIIQESDDAEDMMVRLWTRKEAWIKMKGTIPDDPRNWPSLPGDGRILTRKSACGAYIFSISRSSLFSFSGEYR